MEKFRVAAIVAEYNPFHWGHAWMIEQLRKEGYGAVVCCMSGAFVQRAEPAWLPTHVRAAAALAGGADLVLRLPVPYATAGAEAFAAAGAGMLAALGCADVLAFGSEGAETEQLCEVADMLYSEAFREALRGQLAGGKTFAVARAAAAEEVLPGAGGVLRTPNNILGVEYCKALRHRLPGALETLAEREGVEVRLPQPLALARRGARHDGAPSEGVASASWLREQARKNGAAALTEWVPPACLPLYQKACDADEEIEQARYEVALLSRLRQACPEDYARYGAGEGLDMRLAAAAHKATSLEELYGLAKSKRFAHSRIRRLALAAALRLPTGLPPVPPFAQVLAANAKGLALLRQAKRTALLPVSTSLAKLGKTGPEAAVVAHAEAQAEDLYALCQRAPQGGGGAYTRPAYFETKPVDDKL